MLSVFQTDVLLNELIRRVVFSVFTSALWLLIALGILRLLKVKNPAVKYVFYALALSKGFVALVREQPIFFKTPGRVSIFLQVLNPRMLPDFLDVGTGFFRGSSSIAFGPGLVVLAATAIFLLWRFSGFVKFQCLVGAAPEISRQENTAFFAILDRLVKQAHVTFPKVISVNSNNVPFTVGLKRPVIALSDAILNQLGEDEVEAILAHELAHIARCDNLYHWPIVVMRNVLFFSPLTYVIYHRLSFERERACDDFSSRMCSPLTLAKSLVKIAEMNRTEPVVGLLRAFAPQSFLSKQQQSHFSRRVMELIEPKSYAPLSWPRRALFWSSAFMFAYVEMHISALIYGTRVIFS